MTNDIRRKLMDMDHQIIYPEIHGVRAVNLKAPLPAFVVIILPLL
jgi:hypothetical protein